MRKTLESFQQEWCELQANGQLDKNNLPDIPEIYRKNAELSDELQVLQQELDEARIIAEKARSTYDKLRKQRDFQKINHRRVQQEKQKLAQDALKQKKMFDELQAECDTHTNKQKVANKEKMLMRLEKDRLIAKVESLQISLKQMHDDQNNDESVEKGLSKHDKSSVAAATSQVGQTTSQPTGLLKMTKEPTLISKSNRFNPALHETYEPQGASMSLLKTFKGHMMGVTSLSYNPKKDIVATGSDDTTWKLWSVPNGDLIMSGEGHIDWVGGVEFHPKGNLLATASGDGSVKVWDFVRACCAFTFAEHGQPVWKVGFHDTGDFLLSCSMDQTIKLWDMNMPKSRFTFRGHVDSVNSVHW